MKDSQILVVGCMYATGPIMCTDGIKISYSNMCHSTASKYSGLHATLSGLEKNKLPTIARWKIVHAEYSGCYRQRFNIWFGLKGSAGEPILHKWVNNTDYDQYADRDKIYIMLI